jgi:CheY-like chemotaxis protein
MGTILVIEDEPDIADLVKYNLEKAGLPARVVGDGKQALDLIVRNQPDLIILDLMLPGLDGLEVCRRLRGSPATRGIPVIMLTAKAEEVDRIVGLELGRMTTSPSRSAPASWSPGSRLSSAGRRLPRKSAKSRWPQGVCAWTPAATR